jgi:hypothetical protein
MGAKKRGGAPVRYPCDRCGAQMRGIGEPHRAAVFSREPRDEMLCKACMRVARREDRRTNFFLYLALAGLIIVLTFVEMCFTGSV